MTVEATVEHPFFVFGQGWSSCNPEKTLRRYGLKCFKLAVGDCCISLTQKQTVLPSPPPAATVTTAGNGGVRSTVTMTTSSSSSGGCNGQYPASSTPLAQYRPPDTTGGNIRLPPHTQQQSVSLTGSAESGRIISGDLSGGHLQQQQGRGGERSPSVRDSSRVVMMGKDSGGGRMVDTSPINVVEDDNDNRDSPLSVTGHSPVSSRKRRWSAVPPSDQVSGTEEGHIDVTDSSSSSGTNRTPPDHGRSDQIQYPDT